MKIRASVQALAFLAGLGSFAAAQLAEVMICDPINEQVYRCSDLNGDGDYLDADETTLLLDYISLASFNPVSVEVRAVVAYGLSNTLYLGVPLPLDLAIVGLPGCFLYQSLTGTINASVGPTGSGSVAIPVPSDPGLVGIPVHLQWLVINIFGGGLALSNLGTVIIEQ